MSRLDVIIGVKNAAFRTGIEQARSSARNFANQLKGMFSGLGGIIGAGSFAIMAKGAIDAGSRISDLSTQLRIGIEELQALQFAARQAGVSSSMLERALVNLQQRSVEAAAGNRSYAEAFERLGIDVQKFIALPQEQKMEQIARAQAKAADSNQAYADVATILGQRAGPALQEVLGRLADEGFPRVAEQAVEAGQVMSSETAIALDKAADEIEMFKNRITVAIGNILVDFRSEEGLLKLLFNLLSVAGKFGGALLDAIIAAAQFAWAAIRTPFEYAVSVLGSGLAAIVQRLKVGLLEMLNQWIERINRIPGIEIEMRNVAEARRVLREINAEARRARETKLSDIFDRNLAGTSMTNLSGQFEGYWKELAAEMEEAQAIKQSEETGTTAPKTPQREMAEQADAVGNADAVLREIERAREREARVDERNLLAGMTKDEQESFYRDKQQRLFAEAERAMAEGDELTAIQKRTEAKELEAKLRGQTDETDVPAVAGPTLTVDSLQRIGGGGGLGGVSDPAQRERERQTLLLERIASAVENPNESTNRTATLAP